MRFLTSALIPLLLLAAALALLGVRRRARG
jgi:hypothetical protein